MTYDVEADMEIFEKVEHHLRLALQVLHNAAKKEKGIILRNEASVGCRKRKFTEIPKKNHLKTAKRFGSKGPNQSRNQKIEVNLDTSLQKEQEIIEEIVIDEVDMEDACTFNVEIPVLENLNEETKFVEPTPRCSLSYNDLKAISNKRMLNDNVIHTAQKMLRMQYPGVGGLQDPILGQNLNFEIYQDRPFVQILHDGNIHWVTVSTINCDYGEIYLLDSMFRGKINNHIRRQVCAIIHCNLDKIKVAALPVHQQSNGVDCGVYAIAFVQYLLENKQYPVNVAI